MRTLTYYVGVTLDGFIATPDGSINVFPADQPVLDFIAEDFPGLCPRTFASSSASRPSASASTPS